MHEFKLDPFPARYVKIEVISSQSEHGGPYVGTIQLLGTLR